MTPGYGTARSDSHKASSGIRRHADRRGNPRRLTCVSHRQLLSLPADDTIRIPVGNVCLPA